MPRIAAIRVRGRVGIRQEAEETLKMLRLTRVNYGTFLEESETTRGMLRKVKDYVTWGPVDAEDVALILSHRGELKGGEKLTDAYLKKQTRFQSIRDFAQRFVRGEAEMKEIPGLSLFFRLHPPRKGYGGIKRSFKEGGALGHRPSMKELIYRMR
jgi:large subunit ribosomal protein L30